MQIVTSVLAECWDAPTVEARRSGGAVVTFVYPTGLSLEFELYMGNTMMYATTFQSVLLTAGVIIKLPTMEEILPVQKGVPCEAGGHCKVSWAPMLVTVAVMSVGVTVAMVAAGILFVRHRQSVAQPKMNRARMNRRKRVSVL